MTGFVSWWLVAGLASLTAAMIIPFIDGGELSETLSSVMAALPLAGVARIITDVAKTASKSPHQPSP